MYSTRVIRRLPAEERYALGDQWRRAAYSVALNIAEGASRRGPKEFRRYLDMARSSLHEIGVIVELARASGYLSETELAAVERKRTHCARLVWALIRRLSGEDGAGGS